MKNSPRFRVTTYTKEYTWSGNPDQIVQAMSTLNWHGAGENYMEAVASRCKNIYSIDIATHDPRSFLLDLERHGLITIEEG